MEYNKEITQLRTILKLIGFKHCTIGDRNWLEFTNGQTPLLDYKAKPGDALFGKTNDKIGSWRFQNCPIQKTYKENGKLVHIGRSTINSKQLRQEFWNGIPREDWMKLGDEEKLSQNWQLVFGGFGGKHKAFNVEDGVDKIYQYLKETFPQWNNVRDYYLENIIE